MTAPDRSIEDAALIAFVREQLDDLTGSCGCEECDVERADKARMFTALLSRLEGTPHDEEKDSTRVDSQ